MPTSVKMDEQTKSKLERLQAEIRLETGEKMTQQELLERLVEDAYDSKAAFIDSFKEATVPLAEERRDAFHEGTIASGTSTNEEDIDEILYG